MTIPTISPLGTPPSSNDPANFDSRADALLGVQLPQLVTEINAATAAIPSEVNTLAAASGASSGAVSGASAGTSAAALVSQAGTSARAYSARFCEFDSATFPQAGFVSGNMGAGGISLVNGASVEANHPGVVSINNGGSGTGAFITLGLDVAGSRLQGGSRSEFVFKTPASFSTNVARMGWFDTLSTGAPTDGLYLEFSSSSSLVAVSRKAGVSTSSTVAALAVNTWYHGTVELNAAANAATLAVYSDAGASVGVATIATNLPTASGNELLFGVLGYASGAGGASTLLIDFMHINNMVGLQRGAVPPVATSADRFSYLRSAVSPNATVPVHAIVPNAAESNVDMAIGPKGAGAMLAQTPDNAVTGGNKRGAGAVDTQTLRTLASQVASGEGAAILGSQSSTASGANSLVVGGVSGTASGVNASVLGGNGGSAAGQFSAVVGGNNGTDRGVAGLVVEAHASGVTAVRSQCYRALLRAQTASTVSVRLTADGVGSASASNVTVLDNNSTQYFRVRVLQRTSQASALAGASKSWLFSVLVRRGANAAATSIVGTPSVVSDFGDAALAASSVAVSADTTFGALNITVTPATADVSTFAAHIEALDVTL